MRGLKHIPNALTATRLLMALPIAVLILRSEYGWALSLGIIAGITDALDGFFARRLDAQSAFGAGLDAVADKLLMLGMFLSLAAVGLVPWWLAALVIGRDLVIVIGAGAYRLVIGPFEFAPTILSKLNMGVQVVFLAIVLGDALSPTLSPAMHTGLTALVAVVAFSSGLHYVLSWSRRAIEAEGAIHSK